MKTKYYAFYPRNFGNEYTVVKVTTEEEQKDLDDWYESLLGDNNKSLDRISLLQLRKLKSTELHARKYDQAFSGYCNPDAPITVHELINPYCY